MDPADPNTLYAAMWQRVRRKWSDPRTEPGYTEGGIWKTTDAGRTWTEANEGLPAAQFRGRIGLDVARSNPNVVYALVDNYEPGRPPRDGERDAYTRPIFEGRIKSAEVYRSDDKGRTWRKVTENNDFMMGHSGTYGWVFGQIRVDPADENTIYTLGLGLNVSRDAGKTFTTLRGMHGDHHGLWIDPANPAVLYNANDGGFYRSADAGKTWTYDGVGRRDAVLQRHARQQHARLGLRIDSGLREPARRRGSEQGPRQDSRRRLVECAGRRRFASRHRAWQQRHRLLARLLRQLHAGRCGAVGRRPRRAPAGGQPQGRGRGRAGVTNIRPPAAPSGEGDPELRAQWMAPVVASQHDPATVYAGFQFVFRSTNRGDTWERISPDLSGNDPRRCC